jgi:AraC-like DNA-binding protein
MFSYYRNLLLAFVALLILSTLIGYVGYINSHVKTSLFPAREGNMPWASSVEPQEPTENTYLKVENETGSLEYRFRVDGDTLFPYAHYSMYFISPFHPYDMHDLTGYQSMSFRVQCDPKNVLLFVLFSFDDDVTDVTNMLTRRVSSAAFECNNHWADVRIDLDDLDTPQWWLGRHGLRYTDSGFNREKVMGFAWVNSLQSPVDTVSHVKITDVALEGKRPAFLWVAISVIAVIWILFIVVQFRRYLHVLTADIRGRVLQDQPLMAYKKLSIEPQKDKEKIALLRFMATEYATPDLSLDMAASRLGINRTKINDILKDELGLTFSAYLNKLRLTESARLLSENEDANVSEIAYRVGYNNVSYFNKLFKQEYGCAPKTFKTLYPQKHENA